METYIYALLAVTAVSAVSLIGAVYFRLSDAKLARLLPFLVSLAAGAMLGNALLHLLPESLAHISDIAEAAGHAAEHAAESEHVHDHAGLLVMALALGGFMSFLGIDLLLQKFGGGHLIGHDLQHSHGNGQLDATGRPASTGWLIVFGDAFENFIDGAVIRISFMIGLPVGLATTLAIVIHEIPLEMADMGVLLHSGFSKRRALITNLASALVAVVGCGMALSLGTMVHDISLYIAPVAAGALLYISGSLLVPRLKHSALVPSGSAVAHFATVLAGIAFMALLLLAE